MGADPRLPGHRDASLRANLWVLPLVMSVAALVLAIAAISLDYRLADRQNEFPAAMRLSADDARTVLATLTGATITVFALVVSLTMVVLSIVATNFGPRIVRNFVRRRSTRLIVSAFVATFVFSLIVLASVFADQDRSFVPVISTWIDVGLVLASTGLLVYWVHDLARSIQIGSTLVDIAAALYRAIDAQRGVATRGRTSAAAPEAGGPPLFVVVTPTSGYVQRLDYDRIVRVAAEADAFVVVTCQAGDFVLAGLALAELRGPGANQATGRSVGRAIAVGAYRTLEQDFDYALAEFVEIALRALSPAVNDPFTAMNCIDWITDVIRKLDSEPVRFNAFADDAGILRVTAPSATVAAIVHESLDQLRPGVATSPVVTVYLLKAITRLSRLVETESARTALNLQVDMVHSMARSYASLPHDRASIDDAHQAAVLALSPPAPTPA